MLAAKMFVIQTRNCILKWINSSVTLSVLFSILPKWHVISLRGFGKLTANRGASNPGLTEPASMFVIESTRVAIFSDSSPIRKTTRLESTAPNDSTQTRLADSAVNDSSQLSYNLYRVNSSKLL